MDNIDVGAKNGKQYWYHLYVYLSIKSIAQDPAISFQNTIKQQNTSTGSDVNYNAKKSMVIQTVNENKSSPYQNKNQIETDVRAVSIYERLRC